MTDAGWTSEKPTKNGWYWWRFDASTSATIVRIMVCGDGSLAEMSNNGHLLLAANFGGLFLGPITPTDRQQGRVEAFKEVEQRFDSMFGATDRRIDSVRDYRVDKFYTWLAQAAQAE